MVDRAIAHIQPGTAVSVRTRFTGSWAHGFVVDEDVDRATGYRIRRLSDQSRLGGVIPLSEVRHADGFRFPSQAVGAPDWPTWSR